MFFRKKDKPRERFYLLPGQGGRNYYRKQRFILTWAILGGLDLRRAVGGGDVVAVAPKTLSRA